MDAVPRVGEHICRYAPEYGEGPKHFKVVEVIYTFDDRPYPGIETHEGDADRDGDHVYVILRDTANPLGQVKRRGATVWDHVLGRRRRA
jgi:hypothetical protein